MAAALLQLLSAVARQAQAVPLSLLDGSLLLQVAVSCSSSATLPPSTCAALCQLLAALADHRLALLTSSMALTFGLLRRLLHALPSSELQREDSGAAQLATQLCRVVLHLHNAAAAASPSVLHHYWPFFLHDFLSLCRRSAHLPTQLRWQTALQPAVIACLSALHEHDLTALTLQLPPPEKELLRQHISTFRTQWQWKGE